MVRKNACAAKCANGKRCKNIAKQGELYCSTHLSKYKEHEVEAQIETEAEAEPQHPEMERAEPKMPEVDTEELKRAAEVPLTEPEPTKQPDAPPKRKVRVKRVQLSEPDRVDDDEPPKGEETIEQLRTKLQFLTTVNVELIRMLKDLNSKSGMQNNKSNKSRPLTPQLLEQTAKWLYYRVTKDDAMLINNLKTHLKERDIDPKLLEVKIPYQYVKKGTDLMFSQLSETERSMWHDKAALKLINKGAAVKGFSNT